MVKCNVYDFDGTIYQKDSSIVFYLYCLKRHPFRMMRFLPKQVFGLLLFFLGKLSTKEWKERFFSYIVGVENLDSLVLSFWEKEEKHINEWYYKKHKDSDVLISASPSFLIDPIAAKLNIHHVMATEMDPTTGKIKGENCKGEEKVKRLQQYDKTIQIEEFYSDSLSDEPLAKLSKKAFIVKKDHFTVWDQYHPSFLSKLIHLFLDPSFVLFVFVGLINTFNGILFAYLYSLIIPNDNIAFVVGYLTSLTISYFLNSFIAFKETLGFQKYIKFCISYIPNFIIQNLCVILFLNILGFHKLIAYAISAIIGIPVTYLCIKLFAFDKKKEKK